MNMDKLKGSLESADVVEELIMLSQKVFGKSSKDVQKIIESFITRSYMMGKQNAVKTFEE